jgi:hypothetical protein
MNDKYVILNNNECRGTSDERLVCFNGEPHEVELPSIYFDNGKRLHTGCWLSADVRIYRIKKNNES